MQLSQKTLEAIAGVITGDGSRDQSERLSPYQTLRQITNFFYDFGERDIHPNSGAPSRLNYTLEKLQKFNGTINIKEVICKSLDFFGQENLNPEHAAAYINKFLMRDGYKITIEERFLFWNGNESVNEPYFDIQILRGNSVKTESLINLSTESIVEHIHKAKKKIDSNDNSGAIASAYTLVEGFLKELLVRTKTEFNADQGDIRKLYQLLEVPLNLSPAGENLESYLKSILQGFKQQISGLYELANKASDRHARRYNPARRHAKLAVNAAFVLCEFLLDSFEYQQEKSKMKVAS
jgi:hypothetical protein